MPTLLIFLIHTLKMNALTSCALQKKYCMIQEFLPSKEVSTIDFISPYSENREFRLENASLLQPQATFGHSFLQYRLPSQQILRYRALYQLAQQDALAPLTSFINFIFA